MSLVGLQRAITTMIRLPREIRGETASFLGAFDLDAGEREAARILAEDAELHKYGHELACQRWDKIFNKCRRLFTFVSHDWLEELWFHRYEPVATRVEPDLAGADEHTLGFLDFLLEAEQIRDHREAGAPPWFSDLVRYVRAEVFVRRYVPDRTPLPPGSLLRHRAFAVVRLEHDIPDLIHRSLEEDDQTGLSELEPIRRPLTLLLVRDTAGDLRVFEIDGAVSGFLRAQLDGAPSPPLAEEDHRHLAGLGLCAPRG